MRFVIVLAATIFLSGMSWAQDMPPTISVAGEGMVTLAPDMATITLGVATQAETAAAAMKDNARLASDVLASLAKAGIAPRDMQTSGLNLSPLWNNRRSDSEPPRITGYQASNTISVRVRDLSMLGGLLDGALTQGANMFQGLTFGLQDPEQAQDEARRAAVADALRKARLYAEAADLALGPVISLTEQGGSSPAPMMMMEAARADKALPIAEGELTLRASISMVFAIAH